MRIEDLKWTREPQAYTVSPENSSFKAVFTEMKITECAWKAHDGQQPD
jgi:regulation of enolase protein 1 (concanavalin A-like superfamily)